VRSFAAQLPLRIVGRVTDSRLATWTTWVGVLLAVTYIVAAIGGWIGDVTDGDGSDLAFWLLMLLGGAVLVLASLNAHLSPVLTLVLAIVGAFLGAVVLFWTIVVPLLAIVFAVLSMLRLRTPAPEPG
jgi:hypothetical protein